MSEIMNLTELAKDIDDIRKYVYIYFSTYPIKKDYYDLGK